jgi:hypothetical protein
MSTAHQLDYAPATKDVLATFTEEIVALGGTVRDVYRDEHRLFARAVLPRHADVRPGDRLDACVALRAAGPEILVQPYTFRQVCTNGAIATHTLGTRRVARVEVVSGFVPPFDVTASLEMLRGAVQASATPELFSGLMREMRTAADVEVDAASNLLRLLERMPRAMRDAVATEIFARFATSDDRTTFGLQNAVTSVARDTDDPETRWRLEELGGSVPAMLPRRPKVSPAEAVFSRSEGAYLDEGVGAGR